MLNRLLVITGTFVTLGLAAGASAQSSSAATANAAKKINLEGCLYPQQAMTMGSAGTASMAKSTGKMEQYVVTDPMVISASEGVSASPKQVFKVERVDQARLRELSGKRVQVLANVPASDQLQVLSIVQAEGSCPDTPNAGS